MIYFVLYFLGNLIVTWNVSSGIEILECESFLMALICYSDVACLENNLKDSLRLWC